MGPSGHLQLGGYGSFSKRVGGAGKIKPGSLIGRSVVESFLKLGPAGQDLNLTPAGRGGLFSFPIDSVRPGTTAGCKAWLPCV